jgi:hypothetical protein
MSRIRLSFFAVILIFALVGIGIALSVNRISASISDLIIYEEWAPADLFVPIQSITPSITNRPYEIALLGNPSITASLTPVTNVNCVYPIDYWKEHPELWLEMSMGNTLYTRGEVLLIFDDSSRDVRHMLVQQYYLANLNILSGADPTSIEDSLVEADNWLESYSPDRRLSKGARQVGTQIANILIAYNTGLIGPGFCVPFESLTVTPLVVIEPSFTPSPTATNTASPTLERTFTATATQTEKPDKNPTSTFPPVPTNTLKPTKDKDPDPTKTKAPPQPTEPPPPPTAAPPKPTEVQPTEVPDKPTLAPP